MPLTDHRVTAEAARAFRREHLVERVTERGDRCGFASFVRFSAAHSGLGSRGTEVDEQDLSEVGFGSKRSEASGTGRVGNARADAHEPSTAINPIGPLWLGAWLLAIASPSFLPSLSRASLA